MYIYVLMGRGKCSVSILVQIQIFGGVLNVESDNALIFVVIGN
jgi:hypothetical protein